LHEADPTFSHDGKRLFYACVHGMHWIEIFSMPVSGGASTFVASIPNNLVGITLSGDDSRLVYSHGYGYQSLSVVNLGDHSVRSIENSDQAIWPSISPQSDKLAFSVQSARMNIWRRDLVHPEAAPVELITSTRQQNSPQYSPDGTHRV
jgi:Tol biopolymer transport system component